MSDRKVKLFLSHAWEDKEAIVQKLYEALKAKFDVWYDIETLQLGSDLLFSISEGLKNADYAIVILSPAYFDKKWTKEELAGLMALETKDKKIILPVWHNVSQQQVLSFCPPLANRVAIKSDQKISVIVDWIEGVVWGSEKAREVGDPLQKRFAAIGDLFALRDLNEQLSRREEGVKLVKAEVARLFDVFWKRLDQVQGSLNFQRSVLDKATRPMAIRVSGRHQVTLEIRYEYYASNATTDDQLAVEIFTPDYDYPAPQGKRNSLGLRMYTSYFVSGPRAVWKESFGVDDAILTNEEIIDQALASFISKLGSYQHSI